MPCTPPNKIPLSPKISDLYSISKVVANVKGEPKAMDQPKAISVASPVASWCTANDALIPEPFTSLPCSYNRLTDGPIPFGATKTTLISFLNSAPSDFMTPNKNPWDKPNVDPGFMAAKILGYIFACAASEIKSMTKSDFAITSNVSPRVPFSSVKSNFLASSFDFESGLRPMLTEIWSANPASASESRKFCACAGACDPHPMTPMDLTLFNAAGNNENLSLPPRTMYSCSPATSTISLVNTLVLMSNSGAFTAMAETERPRLEEEEVLAADLEDFRNLP